MASGDPSSVGDPQGDGDAAADDGTQDLATLRARFGPSVLLSADGESLTKQYFLSGHARQVFQNLLLVPGEAAPKLDEPQVVGGGDGASNRASILGRTLGDHSVELVYLQDFEKPQQVPITAPVDGQGPAFQAGAANDLLLVTATPAALASFEDALNLFFANIPQVEIEVKVVEYSTTDALSLGVDVVGNAPTFEQTSGKTLIRSITNKFPLTAPFVGGVDVAGRGVFTLGGIHDAWELNAQLQVLEANGIADVVSSPRVIVRNGGLATISTNTGFPYPQARITASGSNVTAKIGFKPVGITLNIRPVIAGDDTVILQVYARVADVTSFTPTDPVPTPTVSTREAVTSVHVTNGRTTVIGGLVTNSILETDSQVPILGDIPILGLLFRSTSRTTSKSTLEFQITPRILRGESRFRGN